VRISTALQKRIAMKIENEFLVRLSPQQIFATLLDVALVAGCVPGAELIESVSATTHRGRVAIRLGPVSMRFSGTVVIVEQDAQMLTGLLQASGNDEKGRGAARSSTRFHVVAAPDGARVMLITELALSGLAAQYGRASGIVASLANEIVDAFAENLSARIAAGHDTPVVAGKPLSAWTLLHAAIRRWLKRHATSKTVAVR
jgi:carbon monoxide dehydrogenase subunit G